MNLTTWNVQGIRTKQVEVFHELSKMKLDICVNEYLHFYSEVDKSEQEKRVVSIAIHQKLKKCIKSWEEIDERIILIEMWK